MRIDDFKYRFIDQPGGWLGDKNRPDVPILTNLRLDPLERAGWPQDGVKSGSQNYMNWFLYEFCDSCSSNSRWASWPRRPLTIRPCNMARVSTSMP